MFFQISVSPKRVKKKVVEDPVEDTPVLKLAPFTVIPKLFFENVKLGDAITKKLVIENPHTHQTKLSVTKLPPADRYVVLNWIECEIGALESHTLEITWVPKEVGYWRDILHITDSKHVQRDVPIVFKSIAKQVIKKRSSNTKPSLKLKPKSPVKKYKSPICKQKNRSPFKATLYNTSPNACYKSPQRRAYVLEADKENSPYSDLSFTEKINRLDNSSMFLSPSNINFKCDHNITKTPIRRDTYQINRQSVLVPPDFVRKSDSFNDSLELSQKIDDLNFDSTPEYTTQGNKITEIDLLIKLQSNSFDFTPLKPKICIVDANGILTPFNPENCSTEHKQNNSCGSHNSETSIGKQLFQSNNTYEFSAQNASYEPLNISTSTYIQNVSTTTANLSARTQNLSNATHNASAIHNLSNIMQNISGDTYILGNLSSSTVLSPDLKEHKSNRSKMNECDQFAGRIHTLSPVLFAPQLPLSNHQLNFSGTNARAALSAITEEDLYDTHSFTSFKNLSAAKRKHEHTIDSVYAISPPKRPFIKPKSPVKRLTNWTKKMDRKQALNKIRLSLDKPTKMTNTDSFLVAVMDPNPTKVDPFISSSCYYDEKWIDRQTNELKKWLNALLTPPADLDSKAISKKVDVIKLWKDCSKTDLIYAPSKDKVSNSYHTNKRLDGLRKAARNMFQSPKIKTVLSKVALTIESKQLHIRDDKNLHLDVGLQSHVMILLLCYNPLWLRIGLETIYNEIIPLNSNSDVTGLSTFIFFRLFRDPYLISKNKPNSKHSIYSPQYLVAIKKFTLRKFLILIYFLDYAKTNKLIAHDPCLFCKDASIKESREILLSFARELLAAVGDVTRFLGRLGYAITHKQSYIDEFDYAVQNLGIDLRDGIRLTKVMELILVKPNLSSLLRAPPISRLQKVHNVKLAIDSLQQAGYEIIGDITAKDIVDGHREKTLSLLWQIIYKFQAPIYLMAAQNIQRWWRSLTIVIKRKILYRPYQNRINAAIKIQQFYRSWHQIHRERLEFQRKKQSAISIQRFIRSVFQMRKDRTNFLKIKQSAVVIQQQFRSQKLMKIQILNYFKQKRAAQIIQTYFRAWLKMKSQRQTYLKQRQVVLKVQQTFRANVLMKQTRNEFVLLKTTVIIIQQRFRANMAMKKVRENYLRQRNAILVLQAYFRTYLLMRKIQIAYLSKRNAVLVTQQCFRAQLAMKKARKDFLELKNAAILIQRHFRAKLLMETARKSFIMQRKASVIIQTYFRGYLSMKNTRKTYLIKKVAAITIQKHYRAYKLMKTARINYLRQQEAVIVIQKYFRAYMSMKRIRENYTLLRKATIVLQARFRARIAMKNAVKKFQEQRNIIIKLQQLFRANRAMIIERKIYLELQQSVIIIQQRFRANNAMKKARENYLELRIAVLVIQQRYRANVAMKNVRENYVKQVKAALVLQTQFRTNILMKKARATYLERRKAVIVLQGHFRAYLLMKKIQQSYLTQKSAAVIIQQHFRGFLAMRSARQVFQQQKAAAIFIQKRFRMKKDRQSYLQQRKAAVLIQQRFRAYVCKNNARQSYLKQRNAAMVIQRYFKQYTLMKTIHKTYIMKRKAAAIIQQRFRAYLAMKYERNNYLHDRLVIIRIQRRIRANLIAKQIRKQYLLKKTSAILIQQFYRGYILKKQAQALFKQQQTAVLTIQRYYKSYILMKRLRNEYLCKKTAVLTIQTWYKNIRIAQKDRSNFLMQKQSVRIILEFWRGILRMRIERQIFIHKIRAVITIQRAFKNYLAMKRERNAFLKKKSAVIMLQRNIRLYTVKKREQQKLLQKINSIIVIQKCVRSFLKRKRLETAQLERVAALKIQNWFRMILAKRVLEKLKENRVENQRRKEMKRLNDSATRIQTIWRGYRARKLSSDQLNSIRQRTLMANDQALPELTLGQRSKEAISILTNHSSMKEILRALTVLDFTTRLFPTTCIPLCDSIVNLLYTLLASTNRSVPDLEVCILSTSVLINLLKFPVTSAHVWKTEFIETLLTLILHWSDKEGPLFPYLCTLLWLFAQNPEYSKVIINEENAIKMLQKSVAQCERKLKMQSRMRINAKSVSIKTADKVDYSGKSACLTPSLKPDWGLINKRHPRTFHNPLFAIKCLLKKLDIS